jgi:D-glycero-D-manno-heptose 1,7-bisphosphate phosphatase
MRKLRAVFLDRDGVLNELVYSASENKAASPSSASALRVLPGVPEAVRRIRDELGFKAIVISNQPGVAKGQFTLAELGRMNEKIRRALAGAGASLDSEYYCLHHPMSLKAKYRVVCDCRKPKPGLLLRAAKENAIDLGGSYFVGDSAVDLEAGKLAGCKTVLVGRAQGRRGAARPPLGVEPDYEAPTLAEVPDLILALEPGLKGGAEAPGPMINTAVRRRRRRSVPSAARRSGG